EELSDFPGSNRWSAQWPTRRFTAGNRGGQGRPAIMLLFRLTVVSNQLSLDHSGECLSEQRAEQRNLGQVEARGALELTFVVTVTLGHRDFVEGLFSAIDFRDVGENANRDAAKTKYLHGLVGCFCGSRRVLADCGSIHCNLEKVAR